MGCLTGPFDEVRPDVIHVGGFTALAWNRVGSRHLDPSMIPEGALLSMQSWESWRMHRQYLPPHRLLTVYHDSSIKGRLADAMLNDEKILQWYGVNAVTIHPKLSPIPLGFRKLPRLPVEPRAPRTILCYLNMRTHQLPERAAIYAQLQTEPWVTSVERTDPLTYLRDLGRSWIVPSPAGHGPDCYRTWEALVMGAIPVVTHSSLDALYADLPVWLIDDWSEVTEDACQAQVAQVTSTREEGLYHLEKLFMTYWKTVIVERNHDAG